MPAEAPLPTPPRTASPAGRNARTLPRFLLGCALCVCLIGGAGSQALPAEVLRALAQARLPEQALAVVVLPADPRDNGPPRLRHQADTAMNPASLMKLVTTYAALDLLGPAYTWPTDVWLDGPVRPTPAGGVLDGSLVLRGNGDPKLVVERLWLLLRRVRALGVRDITGDIVLDRSAFDVVPADPGAFDDEPLRPYNVQADALLVNYKSLVLTFQPLPDSDRVRVAVEPPLAGVALPDTVQATEGPCGDWRGALRADFSDPARVHFAGAYARSCGERVWPVAYVDPAGFNARAIRGMWDALGGRLRGQVRDGAAPADRDPTFSVSSPVLAEVVRDTNKFSNNVMAQHLLLTLGRPEGRPATFDEARRAIDAWQAMRFGAIHPQLIIDNGAGLSRASRATADFLARLLQSAYASAVMPELMASLPITGIDGTSRRNTAARGRAHLKTGSLRDVNAVAGYVLGDSGQRWVLVAIVNHPQSRSARPVLQALTDWTARDQGPPR